jgi:o-succinylbenzoate synthase
MRIDSVDLFHVRMPLIEPWRTAYGEDAAIESILVRMTSGSHEAWSETSPLAAPCYSPEWATAAFLLLRDWFAPAIVGQQIESGESLHHKLTFFKGNQFAKAALDNAWWVLEATRRPRSTMPGGCSKPRGLASRCTNCWERRATA